MWLPFICVHVASGTNDSHSLFCDTCTIHVHSFSLFKWAQYEDLAFRIETSWCLIFIFSSIFTPVYTAECVFSLCQPPPPPPSSLTGWILPKTIHTKSALNFNQHHWDPFNQASVLHHMVTELQPLTSHYAYKGPNPNMKVCLYIPVLVVHSVHTVTVKPVISLWCLQLHLQKSFWCRSIHTEIVVPVLMILIDPHWRGQPQQTAY